jgi:hypothetical protein
MGGVMRWSMKVDKDVIDKDRWGRECEQDNEKEYSRMSLQDIRFNFKDPTITRPKCDIGIRIFISDFMISISIFG